MHIIPAIDLLEGKCVRLTRGEVGTTTVYSHDPVHMAREFADAGAKFLHVVDLEGAVSGAPKNLSVLENIVKVFAGTVQAGGGIRKKELIDKLLNMGVSRVVLGTAVLIEDESLVKEFIKSYAEKLVVAVDAKDGKVAYHGWQKVTNIEAVVMAEEIEKMGVKRILFTDISRDGTLQGPNLQGVGEMVSAVKIPVLSSGGVQSVEDIKNLKEAGVEGCIVGKALYEGTFKLEEALAVG